MHTKHLAITVPDLDPKYRKDRPVPKHMARANFLGMCVGSRNSGKTYASVQLIKMYDAAKSFDHLYLWAPCFEKDPVYSLLDDGKQFYKLKTFGNFAINDFNETIKEVQAINKSYDMYEADLKVWKKFCRMRDPRRLTDDEVMALERMGWREPQTDYKEGAPTHLLVFDDCVGSKELYRTDSKGPVASWVIKHRHDRCGVLFISQIFNNAVPKQIRSNLSMVMLFAQKNENIRKSASLEFSSFVSAEDFARMWEEATLEKFHFLYADFDSKCKPDERFRVCFDRAIVAPKSSRTIDHAQQTDAEITDKRP